MVVDRRLALVDRRTLGEIRKRTLVAMHSRKVRVGSRHTDCDRISFELAQHARTAANSAAHGALAAIFLGRTFNLSTFIALKKEPTECHVAWRFPLVGHRSTPLIGMVRGCSSLTQSSSTGHQPLTQAQLAALASRNSSVMRYVPTLTQAARSAEGGRKAA